MPEVHEHRTVLRVRYAECDPMGVAHHSSYAVWFEIARTELLRSFGESYAALEARGVLMVITRLDIRYRRPVRYDDVLEVLVRVVGGSRVKLTHEYEVRVVEPGDADVAGPPNPVGPAGVDGASARQEPPADRGRRAGVVCTRGSTELACVDRSGRVRQLPDWMVLPRGG
ncbi:MAG: thioesterase family protein [Planctomycetota bacterium]